MKIKLIALAVLAGSALFAQPRVSVGIGVGGGYYQGSYNAGGYYPDPAYAAAPPCPGPGYVWVDGYYDGPAWVRGYWTLPVQPRYE